MAAASKDIGEPSLIETGMMDQAICVFAADGTLLFFNQQFLEFLDIPASVAFVGARRTDVIGFFAQRGDLGPGDPQQLTADRIRILDQDAAFRYQRPAPHGRFLEVRQQIMPDGQIIATYTDITAARRREAAVATIAEAVSHTVGQGYLQTLANALSVALDMEWVIIGAPDDSDTEFITTLAASQNGMTVENLRYRLRGSPCAGVIDQTICVIRHSARALFPDDHALVELAIESYAGAPLFDADGKALGVLAAFDARPLDKETIAEPVLEIFASRAAAELDRLQTFELLRTSERRFRNFAEIGSDWLWEMDADLRFSWIADKVEALTGWSADHHIGKTREDFRAGDDDPKMWDRHMQTLRAHEPFRDFLYRRTLPNGKTMWVSNNGNPIFAEDGKFLGYSGASTNVTSHKRTEAALRHAKDQAEAANRAKSRFLAGVSHELRTPLNAIIGFSEIIGTELFGPIDNPFYTQYGKDIQSSGELLLGLINDILDLSQIEAEEISLTEKPENVSELVDECVRLFLKRAAEAKIDLFVDLTGAPRSIHVDGRRVKQILVNLIGNAIKFTPAGGRIKVGGGLGDDGGLTLAVEDSGIGMAAEDIDRALEPFSQLDAEIFHGREGVGLGLSIASRLAILHGGRLDLNSEPGVGTRARVLLPASRVVGRDGQAKTTAV